MSKKPLSRGEAIHRIKAALGAEFGWPDPFTERVRITATGSNLTRIVINVPSHSHDLRERMRSHFGHKDQFGVKAVGRARFEIRARNLSVIVRGVEKAFGRKGKK